MMNHPSGCMTEIPRPSPSESETRPVTPPYPWPDRPFLVRGSDGSPPTSLGTQPARGTVLQESQGTRPATTRRSNKIYAKNSSSSRAETPPQRHHYVPSPSGAPSTGQPPAPAGHILAPEAAEEATLDLQAMLDARLEALRVRRQHRESAPGLKATPTATPFLRRRRPRPRE